jgi:glucokinase
LWQKTKIFLSYFLSFSSKPSFHFDARLPNYFMERSMILAGDTGGTKTRLALYELNGTKLCRQETETFVSRNYSSLEEIVMIFLDKHSVKVAKACFGVSGPVVNGEAKLTNLQWEPINEKKIAASTGLASVKLVNDLVATTSAIPHFSPEDLLTLYRGNPDPTNKTCAVLAPGTGLGEAFLFNHNGHYHVLASEGGHADFAPTNDLEIDLLRYLTKKYHRVSYERVLCGSGLFNIYNFLKDSGYSREPAELARRFAGKDPSAVISRAGLDGEFDICVKALDVFASILGAQAGNLALTMLATGGIYLGGGIPPKILPKIQEGATVASYLNKGRLSDVVKTTPLYVIRDDHAALLGAASLAVEM